MSKIYSITVRKEKPFNFYFFHTRHKLTFTFVNFVLFKITTHFRSSINALNVILFLGTDTKLFICTRTATGRIFCINTPHRLKMRIPLCVQCTYVSASKAVLNPSHTSNAISLRYRSRYLTHPSGTFVPLQWKSMLLFSQHLIYRLIWIRLLLTQTRALSTPRTSRLKWGAKQN